MEKVGKNCGKSPYRYGEGEGGRHAFYRARQRARYCERHACAYGLRLLPRAHVAACPLLVHNPYVRMLHVHIDLNDVGALGRCTGYPCLGLPVIEAWRYLLTRGGGIASSHISMQLHQSLNQVMLFRCDALGCVHGQQGCQALVDVSLGHSELD